MCVERDVLWSVSISGKSLEASSQGITLYLATAL